MHPLERSLILTFRWLVPALLVTPVLLAVPRPEDPLALFMVQLSLLVGFGIALAVALMRFVYSDQWFAGNAWSVGKRRLAAATALVALDTGAVALVTLASSAALRLDPSLQFLQLLSALDIAWAGAAIAVGSYLRTGARSAGWAGGAILGVFCLYSIWRYLDIVGFTDSGGWKVSGSDLLRYVIPFDVVAAVVAVAILWVGAHAGREIEQARPQSYG